MTALHEEQVLPDATGGQASGRRVTSLEDARLLLMSKNGLPIAATDPIMMLVTLMLGFADDYEAMLARHNKAITSTMKGIASESREELGKTIVQFSEQVRSSTLENVVLLIRQHQLHMNQHEQSVRQLTRQCMALCILASVVSVGVLVWKILA